MNIKNKGLSLLVLIITIIIMLVLASAVILSLTDRNPILKANETKVKTDMAAFKLEWSNYCSGSKFNELSSEKGFYSKKLNVDKSGNIIYRGEIVNNDTVNTSLKNILPSTIGSDYEGKVFVAEGQLYIDNREKFLSEEQQKWIEEVGVHVLNEGVILIVSSEKVNLKINKKDRIYATVLPDSDKEVSFTMPENRFVQLLETDSSSANVLGTKEGSATLKASVTSDDGITVEKNIVINVNSKGYVYITDITINPSEVEIGLDEMIQLQAKLVPENADIQYVDWVIQTQSDNNVIDLSDSGLVTGKKLGNAEVIAVGEGGDVISNICSVNVIDKTNITLDKITIVKRKGEKEKITATVTNNPRGSKVEWKSDDPSIAFVDENGNVDLLNEGHTIITATCNTKSVTCDVTVLNPIEMSAEVTEQQGSQASLKVGANTTSDTIESVEVRYREQGEDGDWVTKNIPVNDTHYSEDNLLIEGLEQNKTYDVEVEVKLKDGTKKKESLTVKTEIINVSSISIDGDENKTTELGNDITLSASVLPENAFDKSISWSSENVNVATIDENSGKLTTKILGSTTITAMSNDNNEAVDTCNVEVVEPIILTAVVDATTYNTIPVNINAETKHGTISKIYVRYKEKTVEGYTEKIITPTNTSTYNEVYTISDGIKDNTDYDIQVEVEIASDTSIYANGHKLLIDKLTAKTKKIDVTDLTVSPTSVRMYAGKTQDIEVTVVPANASNKNLNWEVQDEDIVTVDENGTLISKKKGSTTVTVISEDNPDIKVNIEVTVVDIIPNAPELQEGMEPIIFNDNGDPQIVDKNSEEWYNYETQGLYKEDNKTSQWANAKTKDGSQWVWIPRFAYKIVSQPKNYNTEGGEVDIIFLKGTTDTTYVDTDGVEHTELPEGYIVHPAFKDESEEGYKNGGWDAELRGIWIAKYEAGKAGEGEVTIPAQKTKAVSNRNYPVFVPNASSYNYTTIGDYFSIGKALNETDNPYGFKSTDADTHQMKNSEWGAVAYLSQSKYGRNGVEISQNKTSVTGCGNNRESDKFNTTNGQLASSTGNIYGIYDLNGGYFEYVAGYINNGNENLSINGQSLLDETINASNEKNKGTSTKYASVYKVASEDVSVNNYNESTNAARKGEAIWETSKSGNGVTSWFGDVSLFNYR